MGRRTVLLVVAALIAALGTSLVFLYVRGADSRASAAYDEVEVLMAVDVITPGETLEQAQQAGKIQMGTVLRKELIDGAVSATGDLDKKVALSTIFPNEQIVSGKFGEPGEQKVLTIPDGKMAISVNLTDPARVAGFVQPGAEVAIFVSAEPEALDTASGATTKLPKFTRLLLPRVSVIGVGTTTVISTTKTDEETGESTTEQLPRTLMTLAVDQDEAERIIYAAKNGEVAFGLLTDESAVKKSQGVTAAEIFE